MLDIASFVVGLADLAGYELAYSDCDIPNPELDRDGSVNSLDIALFVQCVLSRAAETFMQPFSERRHDRT
jgi:hypothetical protein